MAVRRDTEQIVFGIFREKQAKNDQFGVASIMFLLSRLLANAY